MKRIICDVINHGSAWTQDFTGPVHTDEQKFIVGEGNTMLDAALNAMENAVVNHSSDQIDLDGELTPDPDGALKPLHAVMAHSVARFISQRTYADLVASCHTRCIADEKEQNPGVEFDGDMCDWADGRCDKRHYVSIVWSTKPEYAEGCYGPVQTFAGRFLTPDDVRMASVAIMARWMEWVERIPMLLEGRSVVSWLHLMAADSRVMHDCCDANMVFQEVLLELGFISEAIGYETDDPPEVIEECNRNGNVWSAVTGGDYLENAAAEMLLSNE